MNWNEPGTARDLKNFKNLQKESEKGRTLFFQLFN